MTTQSPTSALPVQLAAGVQWLGECLELPHEGQVLHAYHSMFLVHGTTASLLVDSGHPKDWEAIEAQLDGLDADGIPPVRYLFPTHSEVPHSANLGKLLDRYPESRVWGDTRDLHLYLPEFADRLDHADVGDVLDLGNKTFRIVTPVVKDLVTTLWGYDESSRVLFPGDGFAYMHHHAAGECGKTAEELPDLPLPEFMAIFSQYAFYWMYFTPMQQYVDALRDLLTKHPCDVIAPGHGSPIMDPQVTMPRVEEGMLRSGVG